MRKGLSNFRGEQAAELARETIAFLTSHDIPTTATNYEIWISHKLGIHPDLSREIEARMAEGGQFTDAVNDDLFERFFASRRLDSQVEETNASIARELADLMTILRSVGEETGSFASVLESAATSFEGGLDPNNFRSVIAELAQATRHMADHNRLLSEQMATSTRQVATLQATVENARLEALTDGLTGMANRRKFDAHLRKSLINADSGLGEMCLLMCDIDHFKRFNDTWGHVLGDHVIRFIANTLRQHVVEDALAARYGGEEFAVIMPRTQLVKARAWGVSVHQTVRSQKLTRKSSGENIGAVTISVGVAQYRKGESSNDLIGRADACLYASKRAGRDRITTDAEFDCASAA